MVHGRLRLRAWENGEKSGTAIEIEADSIGHDLAWGTTTLTKVRRESTADADPSPRPAAASNGWPGVDEAAEPSQFVDTHEGDDGELHRADVGAGDSADDETELPVGV